MSFCALCNVSGTLAPLPLGFHTLYAYTVDGQEATSTQAGAPLTGTIQAYGFVVTTVKQPPTAISISPNAGSGRTQTFTGVYSDPEGSADISGVQILFNTAPNSIHACSVFYYPNSNLMYLALDGGVGLTAGITPGSSGEVSNSQCTLAGTGSSAGFSRTNLSLTVALTFSASFGGQKNVYLLTSDSGGSNTTSGWVLKGTWTTNAPLGLSAAVSVSPNSGSGATQAFTSAYFDPNGSSELSTVRILFNTSTGSLNTCYVLYYPGSNLLYLDNDGGTGLSTGVIPGSSSQVSNSQCTLTGIGSSFSAAGNNASLTVAMVFSGTFIGQRNIYLLASDLNGTNSGWVQKGVWTTGASLGAPTVMSLSPSSGGGTSQTFTGVYSDPNGLAELSSVRILFSASPVSTNVCYAMYYLSSNLLYP